jgi:hypothetical protein
MRWCANQNGIARSGARQYFVSATRDDREHRQKRAAGRDLSHPAATPDDIQLQQPQGRPRKKVGGDIPAPTQAADRRSVQSSPPKLRYVRNRAHGVSVDCNEQTERLFCCENKSCQVAFCFIRKDESTQRDIACAHATPATNAPMQ